MKTHQVNAKGLSGGLKTLLGKCTTKKTEYRPWKRLDHDRIIRIKLKPTQSPLLLINKKRQNLYLDLSNGGVGSYIKSLDGSIERTHEDLHCFPSEVSLKTIS